MKIFSCLALLFISLIPGEAKSQNDTLILYNGQLLIGELKQASMGVITIDDVDLRLTQVKLYKIRKMVSHHPYRIETTSRDIHIGMLYPDEEDGKVRMVTNEGTVITLFLTELNVMIPLEKSFFKRLTGNLSAGFTYAKSSGIGQVNFSGLAQYATRYWTYQLSAAEIGSLDSTGFSRDNENLEIFTSYSIDPKWFAAGTLNYQRNLELSLSRRFQQIAGIGNKLFVRKDWALMLISGLAFNQEKYTDGTGSGLLLEIPAMVRFNLYKFAHPNLQINTSQGLYIGLTQKGRIRFTGNTSISWQLVKDFWLTVTPYTSYDNQPAKGGNTFDFGTAISFSYRF